MGSSHPSLKEMGTCEKVIVDIMEGDTTLCDREDNVEEARRIVDPVLKAGSTNMRQKRGREAGTTRLFQDRSHHED